MPNVVVIELDDKKNRCILFPPADEVLRGRREAANDTGRSSHALYNTLPTIPGIHIAVDLDEKAVGYFDPLGLPKYKDVLEKVSNFTGVMSREKSKPVPGKRWRNANQETINTWLWAMRVLVEDGMARLVQGEIPDIAGLAVVDRYNWANGGKNRVKKVSSDEADLAKLEAVEAEEWAGIAA